MTLSRINPPGWGINDKLTTGQINELDAAHAGVVGKTSAGDTVSGTATFTNGIALDIFALTTCDGSIDVDGTIAVAAGGAKILLDANGYSDIQSGAKIQTASTGKFIFYNSGQDLKFNSPTSRTISIPAMKAVSDVTGALIGTDLYSFSPGTTIVFPIPAHDGATLSSVIVYFFTANNHSDFPVFPKVSVRRMNNGTFVTNTLYSGDYTSYSTPSLATYNDQLYVKQIVQNTNQNNVIDTSTYWYFAQVVAENSPNDIPQSKFIGIDVVFSNIQDLRIP